MKLRIPDNLSLLGKQPEGVKHLMDGRHKLLLDDMGFGKTCQAVVAANTLGLKKILVVCPPSVRFQWGRELKKWSVMKYHVDVAVGEMHTFKKKEKVAIVCPYNLLLSPHIFDQLKATKWGVLICDEIQNCKNAKAQRTKAVLGQRGLWRNSIYTWGLSGTPMTTTPFDLWPIVNSLGRKYFEMGWMEFTRMFCGRFRGRWGWDVKGATRLPQLRSKLYDTGFALRRERDKRPGGLRFKYIGEKAEDWSQIKGRIDPKKSMLGLNAGEYSTLRKAAGETKAEAAIEYLKDRALTGEKVVVYTWHQDVTNAIAEGLTPYYWQVERYYGAMNPYAKERAKQEFIEGDADLFVANVASAGTGLDGLQDVCSYCVYAEVPWNFTDIQQAFNRLDRRGQKYPVVGDILLMGDSIEDYVLSQVIRKEEIHNKVITQQC